MGTDFSFLNDHLRPPDSPANEDDLVGKRASRLPARLRRTGRACLRLRRRRRKSWVWRGVVPISYWQRWLFSRT